MEKRFAADRLTIFRERARKHAMLIAGSWAAPENAKRTIDVGHNLGAVT
jgi:hypothetical protein